MQHRRRIVPLLSICLCGFLLCGVLSAGTGFAESDPTRPKDLSITTDEQSSESGMPAKPRLTSILIGPHRRLAIIDGHLLAQGQSRSGLQVMKVLDDRVILRLIEDGRDVTLKLGGSNMQKEMRE